MKKILSSALALVLTCLFAVSTSAKNSTAVAAEADSQEVTSILNTKEHFAYINGYTDGKFKPFDELTREEAAVIIHRILTDERRAEIAASVAGFSDIESSRWSYEAIAAMNNAGYIGGYKDGTFRPTANITRAEFVAVVTKLVETEPVVGSVYSDISGHWAEVDIKKAEALNWIDGFVNGSFKPDVNITRADAVRIVNKMLSRSVTREGVHHDAKTWSDVSKESEYYLDVLEATNAHLYERKEDGINEKWTKVVNEDLIKGSMKVVTYNIRNTWRNEKKAENAFMHRAGMVYDKINAEKPDVIAFQEMTDTILNCLKLMLPEYEFFGHGREYNYSGEALYTAIRKSEVDLIGLDVFWMSPTPNVPGSGFENQGCPRICVVTRIRHKKTGNLFNVYNVHLDHIGDEARSEGIKCALERIAKDDEETGLPVILLGDFNAKPDSLPIKLCNEFTDAPLTDVTSEIPVTYHAFGTKDPGTKIDYIFVSDELAEYVEDTKAWTDVHGGIYLSDHYPVSSVINLK